MPSCTVLLILSTLWCTVAASADEAWPDFRGPTHDGVVGSRQLPLAWSESQNVAWKVALPGRGWSTPVVWQNQAWMTSATDDGRRLWALCVDLQTGKLLRQVNVFDIDEPENINPLNSYASPSPVIEHDRVYVHFGTYGTACLDTESGELLWSRRDLKLEHKEGPGSSPILVDDLLVVHCDGMDVQYLIALDTHSGKTVWKTERSRDLSDKKPDLRKAYSTPLAIRLNGQTRIISTAAHMAAAYDAADGREIWRLFYDGFSNVSRPVVGDGIVLLNTGFTKPQLWAVRLGGEGDLSEDAVLWKYTRSVPAKPSVLLVDGLVYMVSDKGGIVTCLDAASGEEVWTKRLGGNFSASPIYSGGYLYFADHDGQTTVLRAGREYEEVAVNQLDEGLMASPVAVENALLLRTTGHLYRIEQP